MISSKTDNDKKIIFAKYSGEVNMQDIEQFYINITKKYRSWQSLKLIQDERDAEFVGTSEILRNAKSLIEILTGAFKSYRIAVIQDRPVETAYSFLFLESSPKRNYFIKVFTLEENAQKWINE